MHLHTTPLYGARRVLHKAACTQLCISTKAFFTQRSHLHRGVFDIGGAFTQKKLLHRETFTQRSFYTEELLCTETFVHRNFYTKEPLHRGTLHTDGFTHRLVYTEESLHIEAFAQRNLYTQTLCTQSRVSAEKFLKEKF